VTEISDHAADHAAEVAPPKPPRRRALWRGLTGSLAYGLVLLAVGFGVAAIVVRAQAMPGPGAFALTAHAVAALVALIAQRIADRSAGLRAGVAGMVVVVLAGAVLWLFWWS
jgi:hypothetical protein